MATALLSLGSNVGDRAATLQQSLDLLALMPGLRIAATSFFHETKPAGGPAPQEKFLNAAARLETSLSPRELLSVLQNVENQLGRVRDQRWGPRTIDLDLLLYDEVELETAELTLPHPRMSFRRFVLEPAAEIASEMVYPINGWTVGELRTNLEESPKYLALSCTPYSVNAWRLKPTLSQRLDCVFIQEPDLQLEFSVAHSPFAVEVGHMERMGRLLSAALSNSGDKWLISDFWFDSQARSFDMSPNDLQRKQLWAEWARLRSAAPRPRLVILFESDQRLWELMLERSQNDEVLRQYLDRLDESRRVQLQAEAVIKSICRRHDVGPTLWLPASDQDRCIDEVLAAIAAMK